MVTTYGHFSLKTLHFYGQKLPLLYSETRKIRTFVHHWPLTKHKIDENVLESHWAKKKNLHICKPFEPLIRIIPREIMCLQRFSNILNTVPKGN